MRGFSRKNELVHKYVRSFFEEHAPRTEDSEHQDTDQQEHPDRHFANAESEPDDVRLMNEIQAVRIKPHESE